MKQTLDTIYRVYRLPEALRDGLKRGREASEQTNAAFIAQAVQDRLPCVIESLPKLGFMFDKGHRRPARLPFSSEAGTLKQLHAASQQTGIAAAHLLIACMHAAVRDVPSGPKRRGRKGRPRKTGAGKVEA